MQDSCLVMDITEASVPIECYPRYQYMVKTRNDLAKRYNDLMRKYKPGNRTLPEINDDKILIEFCKSAGSKDSFPDIKSIIPRHYDKITLTIFENVNVGKRNKVIGNKLSIFLPDILSCELPTSTIIIGKDLKTKQYLSEVFSSHKHVDVCLEKDISKALSTHLEGYALAGMREAHEVLYAFLNRKQYEEHNVGERRRERQVMKGNTEYNIKYKKKKCSQIIYFVYRMTYRPYNIRFCQICFVK